MAARSRWGSSRTAGPILRAHALPALILWAAGCELLVGGQLGEVHCQVEGAVGTPNCPAAYECRSGLCVPSPLGAPCTTDDACSLGDFCLDPTLFGAPGAPRCSRACCTSSDCDADGQDVCWIPPAGGASLCWPAATVGRAVPGAVQAWDTCGADGDCRSGLCSGGHCADTCCSNTSCLAGAGACRFAAAPAVETTGFWCAAAPAGAAPRYAACKSDTDCASGLCIELTQGMTVCSAPCCTSDECDSIVSEAAGLLAVRCITLPGQAGVRACAAIGAGTVTVGEACVTDAECLSGTCVGTVGHMRCSDACCIDDSCGNKASLVCRPANLADAWVLQCELK